MESASAVERLSLIGGTEWWNIASFGMWRRTKILGSIHKSVSRC